MLQQSLVYRLMLYLKSGQTVCNKPCQIITLKLLYDQKPDCKYMDNTTISKLLWHPRQTHTTRVEIINFKKTDRRDRNGI